MSETVEFRTETPYWGLLTITCLGPSEKSYNHDWDFGIDKGNHKS